MCEFQVKCLLKYRLYLSFTCETVMRKDCFTNPGLVQMFVKKLESSAASSKCGILNLKSE